MTYNILELTLTKLQISRSEGETGLKTKQRNVDYESY